MRTVTRGGFTWEVDGPESHASFWDEWESGNWECDTLEIVKSFVKPGTTFIDVGAWIGPVSLWAHELGADYVVALEPDEVALSYLYDNLAQNCSGPENIAVFPGALSDHTGVDFLAPREGWGSTRSHLATADEPDSEEVLCITIEDLWVAFDLDDADVSLVKMDIEGAESVVLETVAPFLAERKIPLVVSMHPHWFTQPIDPGWFSGYGIVLEHMGVLQDMTILIP